MIMSISITNGELGGYIIFGFLGLMLGFLLGLLWKERKE